MYQQELQDLKILQQNFANTFKIMKEHPELHTARFDLNMHQIVLLDRVLTMRLMEERL